MKVKNIAFSGFAAAILMGVCGAAQAAEPLKIASQAYVVKQVGMKQDKLTAANAGEGIKLNMDEKGNLANISVDWDEVASNEHVTQEIANSLNEGGVITNAVQSEISNQINNGGIGDAIDSAVEEAVSGINEKIGDENGGLVKDIADADAAAAAAQEAAEAAQAKADSAYTLADAAQTAEEVSGAIDAKITELDLANTYADKATTEQGIQDAKDAASAADTKAGNAAAAASAADAKAVAAQSAAETAQSAAEAADAKAVAAQSTADSANSAVAALDQKVTAANYMSGNNIAEGSYLMLSDGQGGITWSSIAIVDENGDVLTLSSDAPSSEPEQPEVDA